MLFRILRPQINRTWGRVHVVRGMRCRSPLGYLPLLIWLGYPPCMQGIEGNSAEKFIEGNSAEKFIEGSSAEKFIEGNSAEKFIKVHSHITCVRFSLISAVPFLKMQNVKCEHNHLFLYNPFWTSDANANADVKCEQGFNCSMYFVSL